TTDQLDWVNPEGQQYPHNLLQPLPLIMDNLGRRVIPFDHFINNDLEYLRGGASSRKYTTSVTKTKAADYGHIKWIEDLVPRAMWIQQLIDYNRHALWEVSHWGRKRQQFYGYAVNQESALDVYSKRRIIVVTELKIVEWHDYKHLDWILLSNLTVEERFAFNVSLRMFTRSIVIKRRVEDLQLGVVSYQKRLNLMKPDTYRPDLKRREAYTAHSNPRGFIYQNKDKKNRLMQIDELHKFSDGTLNDVRNALDDRLKGIRNKSIQRLNAQRNLYKALVDAYESNKIILDTYDETVTLKRRRDDDKDKDEEPSARPDRGSKRRKEGKEPESASAPSEHATRSTGSELAKQADTCFSFNELLDTPLDFSNFIMNRLRVVTLTPELLAGPTYELMKRSCKSLIELEYHLEEVYKSTTDQLDWVNPKGQQCPHNLLQPLPLIPDNRSRRVIPFAHFINNDLEYLWGDLVARTMWIQDPIDYDKHALWGVSHWGRKRQQFYGFAVNQESARDVYSKRRIIAVTEFKIVEWHSYKHLDWITVRRDDDTLYKFKEDLVLGFESYQKKLNLTKPDTYRADLKRKEAYTACSNPRGFIYQNKDNKNRLMRIDELHKFSDETLTDVRTALDDRLKGIWMQYLPQTIWRRSDKDRAAAMIQAIKKRLKTRRVMRSLERFVGGRLYE
nr:hypothetical protein [Tanacetum cinerariifolium]